MTFFRPIFSSLVATLALGAFMSAPALATEGEGAIVNSSLAALVKSNFIGKRGTTTLETTSGTKIECKTGSIEGKINSRAGGEQTLLLKECTDSGIKCTGVGASAGEIPLKALSLALTRVSGKGVYFLVTLPKAVEFKCGVISATMKGRFLVPVGAAQEGSLKKAYTFKDSESKGAQEPLEIENENKEKIKATLEVELGKGSEKAGMSASEEDEFGEEAEVKFPYYLSFLVPEKPYKIKKTETRVFNVEYWGLGTSSKLSVLVHNAGDFKEVAGGTCNGNAGIASSTTCSVKILCEGAVGAKGTAEVISESLLVTTASEKLECT